MTPGYKTFNKTQTH